MYNNGDMIGDNNDGDWVKIIMMEMIMMEIIMMEIYSLSEV